MKSENILNVINNFKKVLPRAQHKNHLNMMVGDVNVHQECGTIHCHAGWYAIATCDTSGPLTFNDGASQLVTDLGFKSRSDLKEWAQRNPKLWGNALGYYMFIGGAAFTDKEKRSEGAKTLQDIVDHWEEVYQRVKEKE